MTKKDGEIGLILSKTAEAVDPVIRNLLKSDVDKQFQDIVGYQITTGGKRIRPALTIICSKLFGGKTKDVLYPAAGLEILHNYSLIVDDIIDNSVLRRGKPTVWAKFGKVITQCIGIDWGAAVFQAASRSRFSIEISDIFAKTLKKLAEGEIQDVLFEQFGREGEPYIVKNRYRKVSEKNYFEMVSKKTANLFQSCCEAGAVSAGAGKKEIKALKSYGFNLGMAFQVRDDILDIFGKELKTGKESGKDIREGKMGNIVIHFAFQEFSLKEKREFSKIISKNGISRKEIGLVIKLIKKTEAKAKAVAYGQKFIKNAKRKLSLLPQNKWNKALVGIADLVVERDS